jgi:hypothetical protein
MEQIIQLQKINKNKTIKESYLINVAISSSHH